MNAYQCWLIRVNNTHNKSDVFIGINHATIGDCHEVAITGRQLGIGHALHWATEACPLVGLLTTFLSLLMALLVYGEAGPGNPGTQAAFITKFAIAFGSSIAGGVLALMAFTLHRVLPQDGEP